MGKYYTHHKGKKEKDYIKQKKRRIENDMVKAPKKKTRPERKRKEDLGNVHVAKK